MMRLLLCCSIVGAVGVAQAEEPPTDNPVATFYCGDGGYPAWTDQIAWSNVIDMKGFAKGETEFERFDNARDQLAARGGGVLYYPAGTYDFSDGPFDGPGGRGLMLRGGVVIRGQAPSGKPLATSGKLEHAAVVNDAVKMGRPDYPDGFGEDGFYMHKFGPRIGAYGNHVFVANNCLPISRGRNFKYRQTTRHAP